MEQQQRIAGSMSQRDGKRIHDTHPWLQFGTALLLAGAQAAAWPANDVVAETAAEFAAQWDGLASYCSRLQPKRNSEFAESVNATFAQAQKDELGRARSMTKYKERLHAVMAELEKQDDETAAKTCNDLVDASH
jgi:hypothetical protein